MNGEHLVQGTNWYNIQDKAIKGRAHRLSGELNGMAKLKDSDVILIRNLIHNQSQASIARHFNITPGTVYCIVNRKTWRHIK